MNTISLNDLTVRYSVSRSHTEILTNLTPGDKDYRYIIEYRHLEKTLLCIELNFDGGVATLHLEHNAISQPDFDRLIAPIYERQVCQHLVHVIKRHREMHLAKIMLNPKITLRQKLTSSDDRYIYWHVHSEALATLPALSGGSVTYTPIAA